MRRTPTSRPIRSIRGRRASAIAAFRQTATAWSARSTAIAARTRVARAARRRATRRARQLPPRRRRRRARRRLPRCRIERRRVRRGAVAFWRDTDGIILPYVTIMLLAIVGLSVLALDGARFMSLQTQMQAGADALALAGAAE